MPWAKVLRHGQITFPKEVRDKLGLKEGDIVDFEIQDSLVIMRPKILVDKEAALKSFAKGFQRLQAAVGDAFKNYSEEELYELIEEAVQADSRAEAKSAK